MTVAPQKVVNRAPAPVVQRGSSPVATVAGPGRSLQSPYTARFAGSIPQRESTTRIDSSSAGSGAVEIAGMRIFRTSDGRLVELPPDVTVEQAAALEAEAKAAQKQLGKGPPPVPVPNVKKLAKKNDRKAVVKRSKAKGHDRGSGKATARGGSGAAALLASVGKSKVAQFLVARGAPVLQQGIGRLSKLRDNEQTHDDATEKRLQSERAVVIPPSDGQSKSNAGQVHAVDDRPAPAVDEKAPRRTLQETLEANTPRSIEDVDNFQRDMKAQHMGADVMQVVQRDKNAVTSAFGEMEHTPAPQPPEHQPAGLPPEEIAPPTAALNLGQGAIAPLPKEFTDVSHFTNQADNKLKEEGVTQEQLDMVDNGDLAEANREKKGLQQKAQTEPAAVQEFARQESGRVDKDLRQDELRDRNALKAKRKSGLNATAQRQKGAKSTLEKKREEVASKINGIYQRAQTSVKKKLADLETQSMKRFDIGNAKATQAFETNVNREIDAFKDDRYDGWFGWARKAKDWLLGIDDLPEVKAIFERNRAAFVNTIGKLVDDITADNKRVIQGCKEELARARKEIQEYVDKLGPELKGIGQTAAKDMNARLNELDQFVANKEQELQNKLKDKQTAAIKAIDDKIEKMKEAMSGALAKLGNLLLWAAKKFFTWALQKFGYSLEEIEGIISKGAAVLKAIFTKPIQFVKNLMSAALTGFQNFGKNFLKHLKNALFEWLTGSLEGLVLPKTWDFPGIIGVALQMIGISYANVRKHMVAVMGESVVAGLEKTFTLVKTLVTEGPMAAWEQLKEMASEMRDAFVEAVKDFIKQKIIEQAIQWLVSLFVPGAGIIKAVIGIYDTIVFFIQKAKQIMQMIASFLGSIAEIAAGNIGAAADAMESGLARGLSLVITFLAKLLRLDGITAKIRDAIQKIRSKVDAVLLKVAKWIAEKARKLFARAPVKEATVGQTTDTDASRNVKAKVRADLKGANLGDAQAADSRLSALYAKYQPEGLKSLRIIRDPRDAIAIDVLASASLEERVAQFSDKRVPEELITIANQMHPYSSATTAYVYFDGGRPYGNSPYQQRTIRGGHHQHAEMRFLAEAGLDQTDSPPKIYHDIQAKRRGSRKESHREFADTPIEIHMDINRSPCDECAKALTKAQTQHKTHIRLTIAMASIYKKTWDGADLTSVKSLTEMEASGIVLTPLYVWQVLGRKLANSGVEFDYGGRRYPARIAADQFFAEAIDVRNKLDDVATAIKNSGKITKIEKARS